jgi:ribosomal protein S18 acetylase RimI-like enzyme
MSELSAAALRITAADSPDEIAAVRALFLEYARSLGVSLGFQGFDQELATLPGAYAPPRGCLLIARQRAEIVGCVALRPLDAERCEMKRLYLRPAGRGQGAGRQLAESIIAAARAIGYRRMVLDTLAQMPAARALYASLGFREIPAYYDNPLPGVLYAELDLTAR